MGGFGSFNQSVRKELSSNYAGDTNEHAQILGREGLVQGAISWGAMGTAEGMHQTNELLTAEGGSFISFVRNPIEIE